MKQVHVVVDGVVQGVCFRYYAKQKADELGVTGWIRNNSDGSVEAVVEGDDAVADQMIAWLRHGPPGAVVSKFVLEDQPFKNKFDGFEVRPYR